MTTSKGITETKLSLSDVVTRADHFFRNDGSEYYFRNNNVYVYRKKKNIAKYTCDDDSKLLFNLRKIYGDNIKSKNLDKKLKNVLMGDSLISQYMLRACLQFLESGKDSIYIVHKDIVCDNGKIRTFYEPIKEVSNSLETMNRLLQIEFNHINTKIQTGYKKKTSVIHNAMGHNRNRYIFKADIKNFFPSCKEKLVLNELKQYDATGTENGRLVKAFCDMILVDGGLCLGNHISATLSNNIIAKPVRYMANMCAKTGISFTQYSDDLTLSSDRPIAKNYVIELFKEAYAEYGILKYFRINVDKLRGQSGGARNVTGLSYNHADNKLVPRGYIKDYIYKQIHKLYTVPSHYNSPEYNEFKMKGSINWSANTGNLTRVYNKIRKYDSGDLYNLLPEGYENKLKIEEKYPQLFIDFDAYYKYTKLRTQLERRIKTNIDEYIANVIDDYDALMNFDITTVNRTTYKESWQPVAADNLQFVNGEEFEEVDTELPF